MSSVGRYLSQTPSRSLISYESYIITLAAMQGVFSGQDYLAGHQYTGATPTYSDDFILFDNEVDLGNAIQSLERLLYSTSTWTADYVPVIDLGKKLYLGVQGGESKVFTLSYVRGTRGLGAGSNFYVISDTGVISDALQTALNGAQGYGTVYVARSG